MNTLESAQKIIQVFKDGKHLVCLRDLAREAGFSGANCRDFKDGFNYLVQKEVIKLQQSGWKSEKRGNRSHPKTVLLTADIYDVEDSGLELDHEKLLALPGKLSEGFQQNLGSNRLSEELKATYRECQDCQIKPVLYITGEQLGVCSEHWERLAISDIEW